MILKQVAHFYNTISEQIIDCQYLMLEQQAAALEAIIRNPKGKSASAGRSVITWDSPAELSEYVKRLEDAANRLRDENSYLRARHFEFTGKVAALFNVDLLRQESKYDSPLKYCCRPGV